MINNQNSKVRIHSSYHAHILVFEIEHTAVLLIPFRIKTVEIVPNEVPCILLYFNFYYGVDRFDLETIF